MSSLEYLRKNEQTYPPPNTLLMSVDGMVSTGKRYKVRIPEMDKLPNTLLMSVDGMVSNR